MKSRGKILIKRDLKRLLDLRYETKVLTYNIKTVKIEERARSISNLTKRNVTSGWRKSLKVAVTAQTMSLFTPPQKIWVLRKDKNLKLLLIKTKCWHDLTIFSQKLFSMQTLANGNDTLFSNLCSNSLKKSNKSLLINIKSLKTSWPHASR